MYPSKIFSIKGTIDARGKLTNLLYSDGWEDRQAGALLHALYMMPYLEPALVDGKPTPSTITFIFKIDKALYSYSWKMEAIK
jgi:hypothetical protein